MKAVYHPAVQGDVSRILRHYDSINGQLGDEFWEELNSFIQRALANTTFSFPSERPAAGQLEALPVSLPVSRNPRRHPHHGHTPP
jgi:hypothetical protein